MTARRRDETLQAVPLAVTAIGASQLQQRSITTDQDLQRTVPGLTIRQTFNANQVSYSIRGQSIDAFSGSRPAVINYLDDVQVPQLASSAFYDLDSVQVLKGPQGTLFGRNATGGAVLFSSTKPKDVFGGYVTAGAGDYGLREVTGAVDLPLVSDKLLVRVAAQDDVRGGYVDNLFDNKEIGSIDRRSARITVVAKPTSKLESTTTYQYTNDSGTNAGGELYSAYPCGSKNGKTTLNTTASCLYSPALDSAVGVPGAYNAFLAAHPGVPAGGIPQELALQKGWGAWKTDLDEPENYLVRGNFLANTTTYQISQDLSVKNILGYAFQNNHMHTDLDGSPFPVEHNFNANTGESGIIFASEAFSEEFQVLGKALGEQLTYITGLYFSDETDRNHQNFEAADITPIISPSNGSDVYLLRNQSEGVFLQGTYDLSSLTGIRKLNFTAGARETFDENEIEQLPGGIVYEVLGTDRERKTNSNPSWQFALQYEPKDGLMLYVDQRGSWRGGGFNGAAPGVLATASNGGNLFVPETTVDVEAGLKATGRLLGRPAHINVDAYDQYISNVQRTAYIIVSGNLDALTASVPKAQVEGIELDGDFAPFDWLRLGGSFSYTDARFTSNTVELFGQSVAYNSYADTPRYSGDVFGQLFLPLPPKLGGASVRADIYAQSRQFISNNFYTIDPGTAISSYALVNLHADWTNILQSRYSLSFFMTNVGDKQYYVGGFPSGPILGINTAVPGMPRMYGASLTARF